TANSSLFIFISMEAGKAEVLRGWNALEGGILVHAERLLQRFFVIEVRHEVLVLPGVEGLILHRDLSVFDGSHHAAHRVFAVDRVFVDVIVDHPDAGIVGAQDQVVAFAWSEQDRVGWVWICQRPAVLRVNFEIVAVDVDRVHLVAGTDQANAYDIAFLDPQWLRLGEGLAIDGGKIRNVARDAAFTRLVRPVGNPTGKHQDVVLRHFLLDRRGIFRVDDQRSPHAAHRDMLVDVDVAVIPHRAGWLGLEAIGERFAGCDRRLRRARNAVILPRAALEHAVPMNRMWQGRVVFDLDLDIIAFGHVDQRT